MLLLTKLQLVVASAKTDSNADKGISLFFLHVKANQSARIHLNNILATGSFSKVMSHKYGPINVQICKFYWYP